MPAALRAILIACATLVGAIATPSAGAATVFDTVALLPKSADTVIVVHDGAAVRRSPIGRTVVGAVSTLAGFGETGRAWERVSAALGMAPDEAFDALLGERMAFASRVDQAGVKHWVLVSQIRPEVRDRVKKSLRPSPRHVAEGAVVLSVEDGAYSMILIDGPGGPLLTVGPGEADPMVLEVVRLIRRPNADALASGPELALLRRLGGGHANLLALLRNSPGEGSWTGVVGVARGAELHANFRVEMPALAHVVHDGPAWTRAAFERLSEGALVAAVDISGPLEVAGPAADLILPLGLPDDMTEVMGSRVAVLVRPGIHGPLEAAVSVETTDTTAMARAGDRWIDRLMGSLPVGSGGTQLRADQFASMPPTASRALDLSRQLPVVRESGWTSGPMVVWNTRIVVENCNPGQHQGWWTAGVGAGTVGALSSVVADRESDAKDLPWVAMGLVKPSAMVAAAAASGWTLPEALAPLSGVDEVRWQAMRTPGSTELVGNLQVVVGEPGSSPPGR
jgi:hypothetical protein